MKISIIVPVLNEISLLHQQLEQFRTLDAEYQLIFCDGGSKDGTYQLLHTWGLTVLQSDAGRALQMNRGAAEASGDLLLFVHADTRIKNEDIQAMIEAMQVTGVVGGHFDVRLSGQAWPFRVIEWMINMRSCLSKISTGDQCQFVRRDVFEGMQGFPKQPLMEDVEFAKRLKRLGRVICLHRKVETSSRRWETKGICKTIWLMWRLRFLYWLGESPDKLVKEYRHAR